MGVVGLCSLCGRPALMSCRSCGRTVCGEHIWEGLCSRCAETRQRRPANDDLRGPAMADAGQRTKGNSGRRSGGRGGDGGAGGGGVTPRGVS